MGNIDDTGSPILSSLAEQLSCFALATVVLSFIPHPCVGGNRIKLFGKKIKWEGKREEGKGKKIGTKREGKGKARVKKEGKGKREGKR